MKTRIQTLVSIGLTLSLSVNTLLGALRPRQLTPENIEKQNVKFKIEASPERNGFWCRVTVTGDTLKILPYCGATLETHRWGRMASSCSLKGSKSEGRDEVTYEFFIGEKYVKQSKFRFLNRAESSGRAMPSGDSYWFFLGDFVK